MPADEASLVREFDRVDAGMLALVGGKGANLGEMTRAGLPVPPGFCLTTEAYRAVAAGAGLDPVLDALARTPAEDVPTLADLAGQARRRMLARARCPRRSAEAVAAAYRRARGGRAGGGALLGHRRGPALGQLRRAAGHLPQRRRRRRRSRTPSAAAGPRCGPTGRWPTARSTASTTGRSGSRSSCSGWSTPQVAGVLFTANPVTGRRDQAVDRRQPGPGRGGRVGRGQPGPLRRRHRPAAPSSSGGWGTSGWPSAACRRRRHRTRHAGLGRRPGLPRRPSSSGSWPRWGSGCRRTTAPRRTSSGRSTASGRLWLTQARPDHDAVPAARRRRRPARRPAASTSASRWPRGSTGPSRRWGWPPSGCSPPRWRATCSASRSPSRWPGPRATSRRASGCSSTSRRCVRSQIGTHLRAPRPGRDGGALGGGAAPT